jgi:hypothetical protein
LSGFVGPVDQGQITSDNPKRAVVAEIFQFKLLRCRDGIKCQKNFEQPYIQTNFWENLKTIKCLQLSKPHFSELLNY